ncbi:MAG: FKBP-type peptidyl-prolyl cis-trans isomerase [Planctomycetota bacterium]|nr:FKBP-type peptidyl-prolyl cis-trans isomerase [Planctomycetota bacterium]
MADASTQPSASASAGNTRTTASGLMITDVKEGSGTAAVAGDNVTVNYTGTFKDGKKFDSSYDRNQPFTFALGAHQVIAGWDEGVAGMKPGGMRKLVIPAALGYGAGGTPDGSIPPDTTLYFDVELISASH